MLGGFFAMRETEIGIPKKKKKKEKEKEKKYILYKPTPLFTEFFVWSSELRCVKVKVDVLGSRP